MCNCTLKNQAKHEPDWLHQITNRKTTVVKQTYKSIVIQHIHDKGSSMNDVTVFGGQIFCDDSTKGLVIKRVMMGEGGFKNCPLWTTPNWTAMIDFRLYYPSP